MAAVDDFVAHPRTFMRANIVMVIAGDGATVGGNKNFSFTKSGQMAAFNMLDNGKAMDVYTLKLGDGTGTQVSAWWCPFSMNDTLGITLPGAGGPDTMFTYAMDGCTFVAGSVTAGKDVTVHHVNMGRSAGALGPGAKAEERAEQQRKLQRNIAKSLVTNAKLVDPDDYYEPSKAPVVVPDGAKISTVTFGRRSSGDGWKFYTHQWYTVSGDRMNLKYIGTKRVI